MNKSFSSGSSQKSPDDSAAVMNMIFGRDAGPEPGDTRVCSTLCRFFGTSQCPCSSEKVAGLCGEFRFVRGDHEALIGACLKDYPPREVVRLRMQRKAA